MSLLQSGHVRAFSKNSNDEDIASVVFFPSINIPSSDALFIMRGMKNEKSCQWVPRLMMDGWDVRCFLLVILC